jgi:hypothetical protein
VRKEVRDNLENNKEACDKEEVTGSVGQKVEIRFIFFLTIKGIFVIRLIYMR